MCAWAVPRTWVTAEIITSGKLNTYISDDLQYLYDNRFDTANFDYGLLIARASSGINVNPGGDVPGASITLDRNGDWWIWAAVMFDFQGYDLADGYVYLSIDGGTQTGVIDERTVNGIGGTWLGTWLYTCSAQPKIAKLGCYFYGSGGANITATDTAIAAYCGQVP